MSLIARTRAAYRAFFPRRQSRGYNATQGGRLYADWLAQSTSSDTEIRANLRKLIDRSRDLERNNDYQRGFLLSCERNILGAVRRDLRMECGERTFDKAKSPTWTADAAASTLIQDAFEKWSKKGTCTVCGRYTWREVKRLAVRSVPCSGNALIRKIRGRAAGNKYNFALQVLEIDHLDLLRHETRGANEVRFGIETNPWKRVVAFWVMASHPGDFNGNGSSKSIRVDAEEFYHLFVSERPEQSIGIPWMVSAITRLRQLGAFEEAATIAARIGASKMAFLTKNAGAGGTIGEWVGETNSNGNPIIDGAPGTIEGLPEGWDAKTVDWAYPNIETGDFRKAMLRGVATSVGMSYNTLGNDLEAVNYSSARVGLFEEREGWKLLQSWFSEGLWEPIFSDWLESSIVSGAVDLPIAKLEKFDRPVFKARRWPFLDPMKEAQAAQTMIGLRLSSRRQFIDEGGGDVEDVFLDNVDDEKLAKDIGLSLTPPDALPESFSSAMITSEATDPEAAVDAVTTEPKSTNTKKPAPKAPVK